MKNLTILSCLAVSMIALTGLSGAAPAKNAAGLAPGESLLLAGFAYGSIEPVAIRGANGRYRELPTGPALNALAAQQFKQGQVFGLYSQGVKSADFTTTGFSTEGCFGFGILSGELKPPFGPNPPDRAFVSFSPGFPGQRSYSGQGRLAGGDEQKALGLARSLLRAKGLSPAALTKLKLGPVTALKLGLGQQPALAFSVGVPQRDPNLPCKGTTLAVLAELSAGKLIPRVEIFKQGSPETQNCAESYDLISSFQAEPGSEYLLYEGLGYEANWYEIYKRGADGDYGKVFTGGGGAC